MANCPVAATMIALTAYSQRVRPVRGPRMTARCGTWVQCPLSEADWLQLAISDEQTQSCRPTCCWAGRGVDWSAAWTARRLLLTNRAAAPGAASGSTRAEGDSDLVTSRCAFLSVGRAMSSTNCPTCSTGCWRAIRRWCGGCVKRSTTSLTICAHRSRALRTGAEVALRDGGAIRNGFGRPADAIEDSERVLPDAQHPDGHLTGRDRGDET